MPAATNPPRRRYLSQDEVEREFERIAREVASGRLSGTAYDAELHRFMAESLTGAVTKGYGAVDYDTPDERMLGVLEQNVWHFSAAKSATELAELNASLTDDEGRPRSFGDFKAEAAKMHEKYNATRLRPEYNHAVGASQMAAQWQRIQEDKEHHPLLRYTTAGDANVRQEHRALDGVTKPVDDPFWSTWYPPNGWNCRCDVTQVAKGKETPGDKIVYPEKVHAGFDNNVGKDGYVYPPTHLYYDTVKEMSKDERHAFQQQAWNTYAKGSKRYRPAVKYKGGGSLREHPLADPADLEGNRQYGEVLAEQGYTVRIRPHSTIEGVTNAEWEVNGAIADLKENSAPTHGAIQNAIRHAAAQQVEQVWLALDNPELTPQLLARGIRGALGNPQWNTSIQSVGLIYPDGRTVLVQRSIVNTDELFQRAKRP